MLPILSVIYLYRWDYSIKFIELPRRVRIIRIELLSNFCDFELATLDQLLKSANWAESDAYSDY